MKFFRTLLAAAGLASATNTVTFMSQDSTERTIYFTQNPGFDSINATTVPGNTNVTVEFPTGWIGNFYAVSKGSPNLAGMLAEVAWDSWGAMTFFDVSAIVNATDINGVKQLWAPGGSPISGCTLFPCANAYYLADDVQTKATSENSLYCTLGGGSSNNTLYVANTKRDMEEEPKFERAFVQGKWSKPRRI
jgi:hypothetical protein